MSKEIVSPATGTEAVLAERGARYGAFDKHAEVTQTLKAIFRSEMGEKWGQMAADQRESLEMIAHKLARIINGNPNYGDSWRDIAGYAQLVADRLEGVNKGELTTPFPAISTEELQAVSEISADPHAELRKTWKPGQRWQVDSMDGCGWVTLFADPEWGAGIEIPPPPRRQRRAYPMVSRRLRRVGGGAG